MLALNGIISDVASQLPHLDEWGGPKTFPHFSIGWALAGNTPFQWTKQIASHFGGTRNGMVMHWPDRIKAALEFVGQAFLVDAQEVQDRRLEVVDVDGVARGVVAEVFGLAVIEAAFDAAARP